MLATHSLSGKIGNANKESQAKPPLDPTKVELIIGSWDLRADPPEFLPDSPPASAGPHPGAKRGPKEFRGLKLQFCPSPQCGAQLSKLRFTTVAFTQMGGGHFFGPTNTLYVHLTIIVTERTRDPCGPPPRPQAPPPQVHETTICPFDHYSDGKTTGPLRTGPPPPLVHETTICPFDHYSHGTTTGPLRTTAPTPGPTPPGPRNHYLSI
ncbi:hypothetical protein G5714_012736 [Onychostoma macrolepis]|uniref:Uncharacterized protein n=1 Tax=Onychostoma macrolepis TaxID=369639 RepID=A0A7J6CHY5_9TELE|nr:hypothetical protein G5714_012736 [Onychostoma macrolepis]